MQFLFLLWVSSFVSCHSNAIRHSDSAVTHVIWNELLQAHVSPNGKVDYRGFLKDREKLDQYLKLLSDNHPNETTWNREERLAYWINAYNAFTVELILQHYPLESIKDIKRWNIPFLNTPWTINFIKIGGKKYDLDHIEHKTLRKEFNEPRIHFVINCASVACPILKNEAYTADQLEQQLKAQTIHFINDPEKNIIRENEVQLSKIFSWFEGDFTHNGSLIDFLNQYSELQIQPDARVGYLDYDWGLNE